MPILLTVSISSKMLILQTCRHCQHCQHCQHFFLNIVILTTCNSTHLLNKFHIYCVNPCSGRNVGTHCFFSTYCEVQVLSIGFILFQSIYTLLSQISKWCGLCLQKCGLGTCDKLQLWWNPNLGTFVALPGAAPDLEIKIFNGFSHFRLLGPKLGLVWEVWLGFTIILIAVLLRSAPWTRNLTRGL